MEFFYFLLMINQAILSSSRWPSICLHRGDVLRKRADRKRRKSRKRRKNRKRQNSPEERAFEKWRKELGLCGETWHPAKISCLCAHSLFWNIFLIPFLLSLSLPLELSVADDDKIDNRRRLWALERFFRDEEAFALKMRNIYGKILDNRVVVIDL